MRTQLCILLLLLGGPAAVAAQKQPPVAETFGNCPAAGSGGDPRLNFLKNRIDEPESVTAVTYGVLRALDWPKAVEREDRAGWSTEDSAAVAEWEGIPVSVEGYLVVDRRTVRPVIAVQVEGAESTNCGSEARDSVDWHIWLTYNKRLTRANAIVVEATPRIRVSHAGWTTDKLRDLANGGTLVRISGWLMLDQEHPEQIVRSHGSHHQTRITLWEVHPILGIEVQEGGEWIPLDDWEAQ